MKEALINYITGMVNVHSSIAESLEKSGIQIDCSYAHKASADELESIIDFIEDKPSGSDEDYELRISNLRKDRDERKGRVVLLEKTLKEVVDYLPQGHKDEIKQILEGRK